MGSTVLRKYGDGAAEMVARADQIGSHEVDPRTAEIPGEITTPRE